MNKKIIPAEASFFVPVKKCYLTTAAETLSLIEDGIQRRKGVEWGSKTLVCCVSRKRHVYSFHATNIV